LKEENESNLRLLASSRETNAALMARNDEVTVSSWSCPRNTAYVCVRDESGVVIIVYFMPTHARRQGCICRPGQNGGINATSQCSSHRKSDDSRRCHCATTGKGDRDKTEEVTITLTTNIWENALSILQIEQLEGQCTGLLDTLDEQSAIIANQTMRIALLEDANTGKKRYDHASY
jgi:hypothetical protein